MASSQRVAVAGPDACRSLELVAAGRPSRPQSAVNASGGRSFGVADALPDGRRAGRNRLQRSRHHGSDAGHQWVIRRKTLQVGTKSLSVRRECRSGGRMPASLAPCRPGNRRPKRPRHAWFPKSSSGKLPGDSELSGYRTMAAAVLGSWYRRREAPRCRTAAVVGLCGQTDKVVPVAAGDAIAVGAPAIPTWCGSMLTKSVISAAPLHAYPRDQQIDGSTRGDPRADLYGLGITADALRTRRLPNVNFRCPRLCSRSVKISQPARSNTRPSSTCSRERCRDCWRSDPRIVQSNATFEPTYGDLRRIRESSCEQFRRFGEIDRGANASDNATPVTSTRARRKVLRQVGSVTAYCT